MLTVFDQMGKRLKAFVTETRGNVALIVALLGVIIVCLIGGAIDYAHAYSLRSRLQDACDAGVLAAAIDPSKTEADMQIIADKAFDENMLDIIYGTPTRKLTKTTDAKGNTILQYTAASQIPTQFLGLIGIDYIGLTTLSKSDATIRNTEIAFVLDSTGSMSASSKMVNLKSSVDTMLASLLDGSGANSSNTKVAVVPFDTQVRIDAGINLPYIDYGVIGVSQGCKSGTNGYLCNALRDSFDKVCKNATDIPTCKTRVKIYYKTYVSGDRTYYQTQLYSYDTNGANFTLYSYGETIYTITTSTSNPGGTSTNAETGVVTTTGPSTGTSTTQYFESQEGSTGVVSTLATTYDAVLSGYTAGNLNLITSSTSYTNGYGAVAASGASATGYYNTTTAANNVYTTNGTTVSGGTYGKTKWVNLPAADAVQSAWTGYVIDRYQNLSSVPLSYDMSASPAVTGTVNSLYPARPMASGSKLVSVLGLTTDIAAARAKVQSMQPSLYTNITIGLQWGMEVLSPEAPYTGGSAWKTPLYTKYIILVTDGDNTASRTVSAGSSGAQAKIDARTALACQAAKDKGIIVFTVRVMEGNSDMLKTCASMDSYYFDLTNSDQLGDTMKTILKSIRKIKLAQ
jgi:Flp pilus assembly protein TadG/multimeric flavodoxin WrbA